MDFNIVPLRPQIIITTFPVGTNQSWPQNQARGEKGFSTIFAGGNEA